MPDYQAAREVDSQCLSQWGRATWSHTDAGPRVLYKNRSLRLARSWGSDVAAVWVMCTEQPVPMAVHVYLSWPFKEEALYS